MATTVTPSTKSEHVQPSGLKLGDEARGQAFKATFGTSTGMLTVWRSSRSSPAFLQTFHGQV